MRSLVTGGAGFIGNHLVSRLLRLGHEVVVVDNFKRGNKLDKETLDAVELLEGDVRDADLIHRAGRRCDYLFHLAATLGVDIVADNPVESMEVETMGLRNVAHSAIAHGARKVVYASTSGVYGKLAIEKAVDENFSVAPNTSYAIAKRYNEIYLKALHQEKGLQSLSLRYFNVYGPRQDNRMVIPRFIEQALAGEPLTVFGSGKQTRDFTYIDDTIEATVLAAEKIPGCEIVNICYRDEHTIHELARIIKEMLGSSSEIALLESPPRRYDFEVMRRIGDSSKLHAATGFQPETTLRQGLAKTFAYLGVAVKNP